MSQRRPVLKIVVSNRGDTASCLPRQRKLPIGFSNLSPNTALLEKIDRLCVLRPEYGDALDRLVTNALAKIEKIV